MDVQLGHGDDHRVTEHLGHGRGEAPAGVDRNEQLPLVRGSVEGAAPPSVLLLGRFDERELLDRRLRRRSSDIRRSLLAESV